MPLDEFAVIPVELASYAEDLLTEKCLTAAGYEWPVPWQDTAFPSPEDVNDVGLRLFNRALAASYGYHWAPPVNPAEAEAQVEFFDYANSYFPDAEFESVFAKCSNDARDDQTVPDNDAYNYISDLTVQAITEAEQTDAVVAATAEWHRCLSNRIDYAVPPDPHEWPTSEFLHDFKVTGPDATLTASAAEIDVAVADAECQESSGLSEALYDAEWDAQLRLVEENRDTLERNRAAGLEHEKELLIVVAENAPPAP